MAFNFYKLRLPSLISSHILKNQALTISQHKKIILLSNTKIQSLLNTRLFSAVNTENANEEQKEGGGEEEAAEPVKKKETRVVHSVETSLRYMQSKAYQTTYGNDPVWKNYRRNYKGWRPPLKTRKTCIRKGVISTGNPCPICRDEYLVLDYRNTKLLQQFISPITGEVLKAFDTGLCRNSQISLQVSVIKARDYGYLTYDVPHREYDYSDYLPETKM